MKSSVGLFSIFILLVVLTSCIMFYQNKETHITKNHKINNNNKEENLCRICMSEESRMIFIPCGHLVMCEECSKKYNKDKCIYCRKEPSSLYKIYK